MPTIRIGYSSDFSINSNGVGIGTTFAAANTKLDVVGALKGDFNITGVTTLTAYGGFVAQQQHVNKSTTIGFTTVGLQTAGVSTSVQYYETETGFTDLGGVHHGDDQRFNTLSEDLVIDDGQILNITNTEMVGFTTLGEYDPHSHSSYVCAGSLEQVSVTGHFSVPNGGINDRQETPIEGTVRFNTDLNTLEFFNGNEWRQFTYNQGKSGRAVFGKGGNPNSLQPYQYLNINTRGRSEYFGESTTSNYISCNACGDGIRGLWGGAISDNQDVIEYITMASAGNAIDFGNLTEGRDSGCSTSSSTRGLWAGGIDRVPSTAGSNVIDYVEIQTLGNAIDFGDCVYKSPEQNGVVSSGIRGFFQGGGYPSPSNAINMITIASKGDALDFGDLTFAAAYKGGFSSQVRAVIGGGMAVYPATTTDQQDTYIMASTGTVTNFGNLAVGRHSPMGASTHVRGIYAGGSAPTDSSALAVVDSLIIASDGTAEDYAELSTPLTFGGGVSDSHGGLGGF